MQLASQTRTALASAPTVLQNVLLAQPLTTAPPVLELTIFIFSSARLLVELELSLRTFLSNNAETVQMAAKIVQVQISAQTVTLVSHFKTTTTMVLMSCAQTGVSQASTRGL